MNSAAEKKVILVVDDDEHQLSVIKIILEGFYTVIAAKSGILALEQIYKGCLPDIILLDILMPEMDGFEVYNKIRGISLLRDIPIVYVSSVSEKEEIQKALDTGAADFIMKPYNKTDLLTRISKLIKD